MQSDIIEKPPRAGVRSIAAVTCLSFIWSAVAARASADEVVADVMSLESAAIDGG